MVTFRIKNLEHGWLDASLGDETHEIHVIASYIIDSPGDLVRATLSLVEGAASADCSWLNEPGEYRFLLSRALDSLEITVLQFEDWHPRKQDSEGQEIFRSTISQARWVRQILSEFQHLLDEHGEEGYQQRWSQQFSFPAKELMALRIWLRSL